jgi:hypothetical protein
MKRFATLAMFLGTLVFGWSALSQADTMAAAPGPAHSPIKVQRCDPMLHTAAYPVGYVPGFYPYGGPYFWTDVYGYRYTQARLSRTAMLAIDYYNRSAVPIKLIDFGLVANGRLVAEVRDAGTFSPGAEIKHEFGLNPNVFPIETGLPRCVPLHVEFQDGTKWKNPHLPALERSIYTP